MYVNKCNNNIVNALRLYLYLKSPLTLKSELYYHVIIFIIQHYFLYLLTSSELKLEYMNQT